MKKIIAPLIVILVACTFFVMMLIKHNDNSVIVPLPATPVWTSLYEISDNDSLPDKKVFTHVYQKEKDSLLSVSLAQDALIVNSSGTSLIVVLNEVYTTKTIVTKLNVVNGNVHEIEKDTIFGRNDK